MKKSVVLISILVISVFLSGCGPKDTVQNTTQQTGKAYIGGTDGLAISFTENAPPDTVYDKPEGEESNPFSISIKVENKGEYDVPADEYKMTLTGVDFTSFGISPELVQDVPKDTTLERVRRSVGEVIPGTYVFFDFNELAYQSAVTGQSGPYNIRAALCYPYQTEASSKVCILQDLYGRSGRTPLCKANEDKSVENSGAPVQVTSLKESIVGENKIMLTFKVEHVGDSKDVVFDSADGSCDLTKTAQQNKVGVDVKVGNMAEDKISCSGLSGGKANMVGGNPAEVRCTVDLGDKENIVDQEVPVTITLDYNYYEYAIAPITIKQLGT